MADPADISIQDLWNQRFLGGDTYTVPGLYQSDVSAPIETNTNAAAFQQITKTATFTLNQTDARRRFVLADDVTVKLPPLGVLGNGFECEIVNESGSLVTIDGAGASNLGLPDGAIAVVMEANGKQRVVVNSSTELASIFDNALWDPSFLGVDLDLVHWWDATRNVTLDASSGLVSKWDDWVQLGAGRTGLAATQTTITSQPIYQNGNELRFEGQKKGLTLNTQGRAGYENRWMFLIFRVNWTQMAGVTSDYFITMNAAGVEIGHKLPIINYYVSTKEMESIWNTVTTPVGVKVTVPGADDQWHTLLARRNEDAIYLSIDGGPEASLASYPASIVPTAQQPIGRIGNSEQFRNHHWGLADLLMGQGHLTDAEVQKLHGWGAWRAGVEANLNAASPYILAAPTASPDEAHTPTPDAYAAGYRFSAHSWDDSHRGHALDLTGYTRTFHDHFTDIATISDGMTGTGPWWAPAHIDTSPARYLRPGEQGLDTYTIIDDTYLQIKMQQVNNAGLFYTGLINSADVWGNGFVQSVPPGGSVYYEARIGLNGRGGNQTVGFTDNAPGWAAFWLYSQDYSKNSAVSKAEVDVVECYGAGNDTTNREMHVTDWIHGAYRPQPGNLGSAGNTGIQNKTPTKITDVTSPPWSAPSVIFDGQGDGQPGSFHSYGVSIDQTWIIHYMDGLEVTRWPSYADALKPLYILVALQQQQAGAAFPDVQTYMWIDYVDAYSKG